MLSQSASSGLGSQWWRVGGVLGIGWVIVFIVEVILQGGVPARDDSVEEIRRYFTDDGDLYLVGRYLVGIGLVLFFAPFVVCLRWLLDSAEGRPPILSWLTALGGVMVVIWGMLAGLFWGTLALGAAESADVNDSSIRLLMELDLYAFTFLSFALALFVGAASLLIARTGILWRWLGGIGLLAAVLLIIGVAWPIEGDEEGPVAAIGFLGNIGAILWVLLTSIAMIMRTEPPAAADRAG